jgi:predicted dinucleotide-binding enzyme
VKIGIIGAGRIGCALAAHAVRTGHVVMISNSRGPESLREKAAGLDCLAGTAEEAAAFGEVVFVAIPFKNREAIPVQPLVGKVVVDANNYYPYRDGQIEALDKLQTTTSEMLARVLAGARVVKAFNAIMQADLETHGRPRGDPQRRALPIAGDDAAALQVVAALVDAFGFDPVDAGKLSQSWRFERAKPAYCIPFRVPDLKRALAAAQRDVELPDGSWRRQT